MVKLLLEEYRVKFGEEARGMEKFLNLVSQFFPRYSDAFKMVELALRETAKTLKGKKRDDEEDAAISHPIAVALILLVYLKVHDWELIVAAILHDNVEDYPEEWPIERIEVTYGFRVAGFVGAVSKPKLALFGGDKGARDRVFQKQLLEAHSLEKLLKLADRLHNMVTVWAMSDEKRMRKVEETRAFYIPFLATPLGMLKEELETACEGATVEHDHMDD